MNDNQSNKINDYILIRFCAISRFIFLFPGGLFNFEIYEGISINFSGPWFATERRSIEANETLQDIPFDILHHTRKRLRGQNPNPGNPVIAEKRSLQLPSLA